MSTAIIIPARYGSSRFPGKPLAVIGGGSMLSHVVKTARQAAEGLDVDVIVATEDQRIADHAAEINVECLVTSEDCATGSDRVLEAAQASGKNYEFILNLQGDAPFTPPDIIRDMIGAFQDHPDADVLTPVYTLSWDELDALRAAKKTTAFSGTTAIIDANGRAIWFSKNIIPAIRGEQTLRADTPKSPVVQHIGLYGYRRDALERFCALPQSPYELLEGLEQLRFLENGMCIQTLLVDNADGLLQAGIDTPEDLARAESRFS